MTITLSITEARNKFLNLIRDAHDVLERVIITKNGKPEAVLISYDEYEGWVETLEIMKDPQLVKEIKEAQKEVKAGHLLSWDEVVREKSKKSKAMKKK